MKKFLRCLLKKDSLLLQVSLLTLASVVACQQVNEKAEHAETEDGASGVVSGAGATPGARSASTGRSGNGTGSSDLLGAAAGGVILQKVSLAKGQDFTAQLQLGAGSQNLTNTADVGIEISVIAADGSEQAYVRTSLEEAAIDFTPPSDGDYTVMMKNNSDQLVELADSVLAGEVTAEEAVSAEERVAAPFKDYTLKAVVTFSSVCKQNASDGNATLSFKAPAGQYYIQPFVFWGKVGADHKVTSLSQAKIAIKAAGVSIPLQRLGDLSLASYREHSSLSKAEHEDYTRTFYQHYFGAAGELYTLDTFRFGGDCAAAKTIAIPSDAGQADIKLSLVDTAAGVDTSFKIRPSVSAAFSMYEATGSRINDWTQCTYNRLTGEPTTYNGNAAQCKSFSLAAPPYIRLDYRLPSAAGAGITSASDPTRILYYGHSFAKEWYTSLITHADALWAGSKTSVELSRCLNNGGLVAVPISAQATYIPLSEFNSKVGDVVNLARKAGSYTALTEFFQGNIDAAGELTYPSCIPGGGSACADFKLLKVKMSTCSLKADSGISVTALGESFIYPEYFDISGVITE